MKLKTSIELQKIDCNCSDCIYMQRDMARFRKSIKYHNRWQLDYFNKMRDKIYKKAKLWLDKGYPEKHDIVKKEADKMRFQFDKSEVTINYGYCIEFKKDVSFIPNICQLETQHCFKHRRDET